MDEVMREAAGVHKEFLMKGDSMRSIACHVATLYFDIMSMDKHIGQYVEMSSMNQYDLVLGFPLCTRQLTMGQITDMSILLRKEMAKITGRSYESCVKKVQVFYHNLATDRPRDNNSDLECRYNCGPGEFVVQGKPYLGIAFSLHSAFDLNRYDLAMTPTTDIISYVEHCKRKTHYAMHESKAYLWEVRDACQHEGEEDVDTYQKTLANVDGFDPDKVSVYYEQDKQYVHDLDAILNNKEYDPPAAFVAHMENEIERVRNVWWRLGIQL